MKTPVINLVLSLLMMAGLPGIASADDAEQPFGNRELGPGKGRGLPAGPDGRNGPAGLNARPGMGGKEGKERKRFEAFEAFKGFKQADLDGDNKLSFAEFSNMKRLKNIDEEKRRKLFDFLDRDNDGVLLMHEIQPREPKWLGALRRGFDQLDADNDGSLNLSEFSGLELFSRTKRPMGARMAPKIFEKIDRNKDGKIEKFELKAMSGGHIRPDIDFSKYDTNSSGGLDYGEYAKIPWMLKCPEQRRKKLFDRIDANGDGEISKEEVKAAHQMRRPGHSGKRPFKPHGANPRNGGPSPAPGRVPDGSF